MRISDLLNRWQQHEASYSGSLAQSLHLPLRDMARVQALQVMYPSRTEEEILADLLHAALDELETAMPYVPGGQVIAEDDQGDPIYEDLGPTPRFFTLSREFLRKLAQPLSNQK
ncbi:MAG: type 1 pili tip component [Thiobacillaceae bacterium]